MCLTLRKYKNCSSKAQWATTAWMLSVQWKINNLFKGTKILYCCRNQQFCFYKNAYILEFSSLQLFKSKEKHTVIILYLKSFTLLITFFSERKFLNDKNYKIVKKHAINIRIDGTVYFWPGRGTICGACATCVHNRLAEISHQVSLCTSWNNFFS